MRGPRTAMKSGPRLTQLEKALAQKQRPNTAKKNKLKKKKQHYLSTPNKSVIKEADLIVGIQL